MSPTPTPEIPVPGESGTLSDYLGADSTSPSLDEVLTEIAANADPSAVYGQNLDAALDSVSQPIFGVDYVPATGLIVTVSPLVLALTVLAAVIVGVLVARRRASGSSTLTRARFIERERQAAKERDAAAKVTASKAAAAEGTDR